MIRRLLLLNGVAVIGAVINHASGWGFVALIWWADRYQLGPVPNFHQVGTPAYFGLRGLEQLIMFAIPAFLFVSGFFIAFATGRQKHTVGWRVVTARIRMLVIPYLIWSILILALRMVQGESYTLLEVAGQLLFGRAAPPYYYVPLVIQFFLLSPLLVPLARRRWRSLLLASALVQITVHLAQYPLILGRSWAPADLVVRLTPGWFFPQTAFWFALGVVAGFHLPAFKGMLARRRRLLLAGTVLFGVLAYAEWELLYRLSGQEWLPPSVTLLDSLYAGCFILTFMAFGDVRLPAERPLNDLGTKSFGVYLIHSPVLEVISRLVYHLVPALLAVQLLYQPLLLLAGLGVPLLLMALANRSPARGYYQYVFG